MAITFDASSQGANDGNVDATWSHTINSGSNRFLVAVGQHNRGLTQQPTYNGIDADFLTTLNDIGSSSRIFWLAGWANPPVGTANINFKFDSTSALQGPFIGMSFFGVDQGGPAAIVTDGSNGSETSKSNAIDLLYANSWTVEHQGGVSTPTQDITQDEGQDERLERDGPNDVIAGATKEHTATGSTTLGFSFTVGTTLLHGIWELPPAGSRGGGNFLPFL
jgi:hypothetical protein